jgi:hypothetical protein
VAAKGQEPAQGGRAKKEVVFLRPGLSSSDESPGRAEDLSSDGI